jgi:hypothetical protein
VELEAEASTLVMMFFEGVAAVAALEGSALTLDETDLRAEVPQRSVELVVARKMRPVRSPLMLIFVQACLPCFVDSQVRAGSVSLRKLSLHQRFDSRAERVCASTQVLKSYSDSSD